MAANEGLVLDTLSLNDGTTYTLEAVQFPVPGKRAEWVTGGDIDGGILVRDPLLENRVITARVRVEPQSTMDLALAKISAISDKLEEAERTVAGVTLVWTPADATKTTTFYVLSGTVTDLPVSVDGDGAGWFVKAPVITIEMTCKPYGYLPEVVGTPASTTDPLATIELTAVTGDAGAEGRLIATDAATQSRRHFEWGLESLNYPTSSPPSLILDSDGLATSGFAGTGTTRSGAYDPGAAGNSVIRGTLSTQLSAICGTGVLTHIGTFRVKARLYGVSADTTGIQTRFSWQDGDGPMRANNYVTLPVVNNWTEVDLGTITIATATLGTQKWQGQVEAYSTTVGDTLDVDYLLLIPCAEGYGISRSAYAYTAGVQNARDEFTSIAATTVLTGRAAPSGGSWVTTSTGVATDYTAADLTADAFPGTGDEAETRATVSEAAAGRMAILGSTNYTNTEVQAWIYSSAKAGVKQGVVARWVDASNFLTAYVNYTGGPTHGPVLVVAKTIVGVASTIASVRTNAFAATMYIVRVVIFASGGGTMYIMNTSGAIITTLSFADTTLATGGTLATGKPGMYDANTSALTATRYYDNFSHSTPAAEPIAIYSGRTLEVRSDSTIRQDSTGTYYGNAPAYRGSRFYVPPAGTRTRKARIVGKAKRNDVAVAADDQIADSLTLQANYTPRVLVVPR